MKSNRKRKETIAEELATESPIDETPINDPLTSPPTRKPTPMSTYDSRESLMAAPMEEFEAPKLAPDGHYYGTIIRHPEWVDRSIKNGPAAGQEIEILSYPLQFTEAGEDIDPEALDGVELSSMEMPYEFWVWNKTKRAPHSRGVMFYLRKFHKSLGFDETLPNEQVLAETVGRRVLITLGHDKENRFNRILEVVGAGN